MPFQRMRRLDLEQGNLLPWWPEDVQPAVLYASTPLSDHDIRIIHLDGPVRWAKDGGPLVGTFERVSLLNGKPKFTALSYVWGTYNEPRDTIICAYDGRSCAIEITAGCASALRGLRANFGHISIWVDALCINQEDDTEKAQQIPLMAEIYTRAAATYIWLGEGTPESDRGIQALLEASYLIDWPQFAFLPYMLAPRGPGVLCSMRSLALHFQCWAKSILRKWRTFALLSRYLVLLVTRWKNPYNVRVSENAPESALETIWQDRAWTFQELVLSSNPVVVRGSRTLSWMDLVLGISAIDILRWAGKGRQPPRTARLWLEMIRIWMESERPNSNFDELTTAVATSNVILGDLLYSGYWYEVQYWPIGIGCFLLLGLAMVAGSALSTLLPPERHLWSIFGILGTCFPVGMAVAAVRAWILEPSYHDMSDVELETEGARLGAKFHKNRTDAVLQAMRIRKTSRSEDRVYAYYGILSACGLHLAPPNYAKPDSVVHRELFRALLEWEPALISLLANTGNSVRPTGASSWVPGFTDNFVTGWLNWDICLNGVAASATTKHDKSPQVSGDGRSLVVQAKRHGSIFFRSGLFEAIPEVPTQDGRIGAGGSLEFVHAVSKLERWVVGMKTHITITDAYFSVPLAVAKTIRASPLHSAETPDGTQWPNSSLEASESWYRSLALQPEQPKAHTAGEPDSAGGTIQMTNVSARLDSKAVAALVQDCNNLANWKVQLIISDRGYIGLGPADLEDGDVIVLVAGVAVPLALRRVEDSAGGIRGYNVIGPAFVHSIMDGEDWSLGETVEIMLI